VSDIIIEGAASKKTVPAHSPALDAAGLLRPGCKLLVTRNSKKCKTAYAIQLVEDEGELVLANPICANRIVRNLLDHQLIPSLSSYHVTSSEVQCGKSRFDFQLQHCKDSERKMFLEVKHVSTVDIASDACEPPRKPHFIVRSSGSLKMKTYTRSALFPVDKAHQQFKGKPVVSERAIRHVSELRKLQERGVECCVLFLVCRGDAESFRPCHECCSLFSQELMNAQSAGVKIVAAQVRWNWKGNAIFKRELPVHTGQAPPRKPKSDGETPRKRPAKRVSPAPKQKKRRTF